VQVVYLGAILLDPLHLCVIYWHIYNYCRQWILSYVSYLLIVYKIAMGTYTKHRQGQVEDNVDVEIMQSITKNQWANITHYVHWLGTDQVDI
jgi:hypothetical protein